MISGIYIEFFCPKCGYYPQERINGDDDTERAKKVIIKKIKKHQKETSHIPKEIYKKFLHENN